jgi:hypothetical protein
MATTTKIIDIDAVRNDIQKVCDVWQKKFEEFFASRENSPLRPTIVANSSSRLLLPEATTPSLPAAPHNEDAASHATVSHIHSDLPTKIGNNDVRRNGEHPRPTWMNASTPPTASKWRSNTS